MDAQPQRKKPNRVLLIVLGSVAGVLALCLVVGIVGAIVGGGKDKPDAAATPTGGQTSAAAVQSGIPPAPDKANWDAYIAALKKVDPDIVHSKEEKAVDRGRNQCSSVTNWPNDQAKLVDLTNTRFTSPNHPEGFGPTKSEQILTAVRRYICPTY